MKKGRYNSSQEGTRKYNLPSSFDFCNASNLILEIPFLQQKSRKIPKNLWNIWSGNQLVELWSKYTSLGIRVNLTNMALSTTVTGNLRIFLFESLLIPHFGTDSESQRSMHLTKSINICGNLSGNKWKLILFAQQLSQDSLGAADNISKKGYLFMKCPIETHQKWMDGAKCKASGCIAATNNNGGKQHSCLVLQYKYTQSENNPLAITLALEAVYNKLNQLRNNVPTFTTQICPQIRQDCPKDSIILAKSFTSTASREISQ